MALILASAGDDIKLWESSDFILSRQLNPHDQNVSMVCWGNDNSFLASISMQTEDVAITNMKTYEISTIPCGAGCMCIDINEAGRYMLTGGTDTVIAVWDLKTRKVRKKYKGHSAPVTCAKFNAGTSYIASGSESGEIIVHNVVTAQSCVPLVGPRVQSVKQLQFSRHKKSLLGSVSDDGNANLWDISTQKLVHGFSNHKAPATGISFSPINDMFLISVGLDKRIACYDVQAKKAVKLMSAGMPLTSVDTLDDGVTVAVGSTRGKIFHYDLRMGSVPVKTVDAHKSSVQSVRFQMENDHINSSRNSATASSKQAKHRQLPASPRANGEKDMTAPATDKRPPVPTVGEDVFSPLREGFQSTEEMEQSNSGSFNLTQLNANNSTDICSAGVFSPLNENAMGRSSSGMAMSPLAVSGYNSSEHNSNMSGHGLLDYSRIGAKSTVPGIRIMHPSENGELINCSPTSNSLPFNTRQTPGGGVPVTTPIQNLHSSDSTHVQTNGQAADGQKHVAFVTEEPDKYVFSSDYSGSTEGSHSPELKRQKHMNQQQIGMSASPSFPSMQLDDSPGNGAGGANSVHRLSHPSTPEGVNPQSDIVTSCDIQTVSNVGPTQRPAKFSPQQQFSGDVGSIAQIVRKIVQEELGSFRQDFRKDMQSVLHEEIDELMFQIHRDIINLQAQMLIQFEVLHTEMHTLFQQYSLNQDLVSEIDRLQDELRRLRKNF